MDKNVNTTPHVSVILPVYNGEKYLRACIDSVLAQTYSNFELIILNDGSGDGSAQIIQAYSDQRVVYVSNETNMGLIGTLNKAIVLAKGKYIARMDADDVCLPQRLEKQVQFLETNSSVGLLGTWFYQMHGTKRTLKKLLTGTHALRAELLFRSPFAHPTVMMRKSVLDEMKILYDPAFRHAEDFELWTRLADITEVENLPEPFLLYRMHDQQVTQVQAGEKESTRRTVLRNQLAKAGIVFSEEEFEIHDRLSNGISGEINFLVSAEQWLMKILLVNRATKKLHETELRKVLAGYWLKACENSGQGRKAWKLFRNSELMRSHEPGMKSYLKLAAKLLTGYKQHG